MRERYGCSSSGHNSSSALLQHSYVFCSEARTCAFGYRSYTLKVCAACCECVRVGLAHPADRRPQEDSPRGGGRGHPLDGDPRGRVPERVATSCHCLVRFGFSCAAALHVMLSGDSPSSCLCSPCTINPLFLQDKSKKNKFQFSHPWVPRNAWRGFRIR